MRMGLFSDMRSIRGLAHMLTREQPTMAISQSFAHSPAKLAVGALHRTSALEWDQLKTWEVVLVGRHTCPAFAANSPAKSIIDREKCTRELPLRSSSLPTNLIAHPANSPENISNGWVITTFVWTQGKVYASVWTREVKTNSQWYLVLGAPERNKKSIVAGKTISMMMIKKLGRTLSPTTEMRTQNRRRLMRSRGGTLKSGLRN